MVRDQHTRRMFNLAEDIDLQAKIAEVGDVRLIQIDPISAYLGNQIDSFRTTAVRSVLAPLVDLAGTKVSIIGMLHFNKKLDVNNALLWISDSLAFGATARHVYAVVDDSEPQAEAFRETISQSADNKSLAYRFRERDVGFDEETGEVRAPYIQWETEHVEVTASQAMAATGA